MTNIRNSINSNSLPPSFPPAHIKILIVISQQNSTHDPAISIEPIDRT